MSESRILMLARDGPSTRMIFHALRREFGAVHVIMEDRKSRARLALRRIQRLGIVQVMGQVGFQVLVRPILNWLGRQRIEEIKEEFHLEDSPIVEPVLRVTSVNSEQTRAAISRLSPAIVVVSGTRIIARNTLDDILCPVINMHFGLTPLYRGVHGGYWALAEGRPELVGTTIHYVDAGIDTGAIIDQATFGVSRSDTVATYPYLHIGAGLSILVAAVRNTLAGRLPPSRQASELPSKLRSHPTIWGYLGRSIRDGVR